MLIQCLRVLTHNFPRHAMQGATGEETEVPEGHVKKSHSIGAGLVLCFVLTGFIICPAP